MKALVQSPFSEITGYGKNGTGLVRTLVNWGIEVHILPAGLVPPVHPSVAQLFMVAPDPPYDLFIQHVSPDQIQLGEEIRKSANFSVAWTYWRHPNLNIDNNDSLHKRLSEFDLVLGYNHSTVDAINAFTSVRAEQLQGGFESKPWRFISGRNWNSENFNFLMAGNLDERKNVSLAIAAFTELRDEHPEFAAARLNLKTSKRELFQLEKDLPLGVNVYSGIWSHSDLKKFYASNHVLLSPDRGVGNNLPALEFMATGGTVIATNWGGNKGWLSGEYAYPLGHRSIDLVEPEHWAAPSKDHLKQLMLHTFNNRIETKNKGSVASSVIPQMLDWENVLERFFIKIGKTPNGQPIKDKAMFCRAQEARDRESESRD